MKSNPEKQAPIAAKTSTSNGQSNVGSRAKNAPAQSKTPIYIWIGFFVLLMIGSGYSLYTIYSATPTYLAEAIIQIPSQNVSDGANTSIVQSLSDTIEDTGDGGTESAQIVITQDSRLKNSYDVTARALTPNVAVTAADERAKSIVDRESKFSQVVPANGSDFVVPKIVTTAAGQEPTKEYQGDTDPNQHLPAVAISVILFVVGFFGFVASLMRLKPTKAEPPAQIVTPQGKQIARVHTLVTVSKTVTLGATRLLPKSELRYSDGARSKDDPASKIEIPSATDTPVAPGSIRTDIDEILYQRLEEYKRHSPDSGCVLLVTETLPTPSQLTSRTQYQQLNGASAALGLARKVAKRRGSQTLIIDTGSRAWSLQRATKFPQDIVNLPNAPGVYDILSGKAKLADCVLEDDDLPELGAITAGRIPNDWATQIASDRMHILIRQSRKLADLIIVYAPRCFDRPEIVRLLGEWTNGILIVSGVDQIAESAELQGLSMLSNSAATIFGRIALNTATLVDPEPETTAKMLSPEQFLSKSN